MAAPMTITSIIYFLILRNKGAVTIFSTPRNKNTMGNWNTNPKVKRNWVTNEVYWVIENMATRSSDANFKKNAMAKGNATR